jgi:hypothetical protein
MSEVTLIRTVKPTAVLRDGKTVVVEDVTGLSVLFTDDDGRKVSLAFDGRATCTDEWTERVEVYQLYSDCPIIRDLPDGEREQSGPTDRVIRLLREALLDLND